VVTVGLTLVEPLAMADVKLPGMMAILVAPVVDQLRALLEPELIVAGLAVKEAMVGLAGALALTVTVTMEVFEPAEFVAVRV